MNNVQRNQNTRIGLINPRSHFIEHNNVKNFNELISLSLKSPAVCFYLSTAECNVCKVLKPKVIELISNEFPLMQFHYVDLNEAKEIAGQLSVFTVPTILVFFDGKEMIRASRNIHIDELREQINRCYQMIFSN